MFYIRKLLYEVVYEDNNMCYLLIYTIRINIYWQISEYIITELSEILPGIAFQSVPGDKIKRSSLYDFIYNLSCGAEYELYDEL